MPFKTLIMRKLWLCFTFLVLLNEEELSIKSKCAKAHLKSLDSNLEAIHCRDGRLGAARVVKTYKPKAFALVCCSINEYLRQKQFVTQQKVF